MWREKIIAPKKTEIIDMFYSTNSHLCLIFSKGMNAAARKKNKSFLIRFILISWHQALANATN